MRTLMVALDLLAAIPAGTAVASEPDLAERIRAVGLWTAPTVTCSTQPRSACIRR